MRNLRVIIILISFCTPFCEIQAQSGNKRSDKLLAKAKEAEKSRDPWGAVKYYKQAIDKYEGNQEAWFRIGLLYRMYMNDIDSMQWAYENLLKQEPIHRDYTSAYYYVSDILYRKGQYQKAKAYLETYYRQAKPVGKTLYQANGLMADIEFSLDNLVPSHQQAYFEELTIPGAPQQIYFPELTPDKRVMLFTAMNGGQEDIFISKPMADGTWSPPASISSNINTFDNEGAASIAADGRTLIFTACNRRGGYGSCDLYISYKEGNEWSRPDNLGSNVNSSAWESQPALSADGRTLYFSSNRKGGLGGRDIYVSYFKNGSWTKAENLGVNINTPGDEISPFIFADGKSLFFGSNGYSGFGGFDLYFTQKETSVWSEPKNIGNHINDYHDQISIFISSDQQEVFYSTEQRLGKERTSKIYQTDMSALPGINLSPNGFIKGKVADATTEKPLRAEIQLFDYKQDTLLYTVESDPISGEYLMVIPYAAEFSFYAEAEGYMIKSNTFEIRKESGNFELIISLDPIGKGSSITLEHLYFDFDSYEVRPESYTEIKRIADFLKRNPALNVEIAGYTDSTGSAEYNLVLSQQRADAVKEIMLKCDIPVKNIVSKGYGAQSSQDSSRRVELVVR